eukprot:CAMPEP_0175076082 /NCGR_PEP_ID=MMETSP0052_2-20121109/22482_1 /TAXON_ID=51329 ORGANISM="Polytomella parva, Strain SAG 63-3" /NCGR_SAMPLE_ID=MMETSP0052_2 /ASSEMBLY_ACC=CAM_ASM_000194 /LENGTH=109 /DNA_ID=CAMNT_0016345087 /DNA_START=62 /DNA_END=391 /DNA_ORIENTATION=+
MARRPDPFSIPPDCFGNAVSPTFFPHGLTSDTTFEISSSVASGCWCSSEFATDAPAMEAPPVPANANGVPPVLGSCCARFMAPKEVAPDVPPSPSVARGVCVAYWRRLN